MKPPASTLVLDAAILISAVVGRSAGAILVAQQALVLLTTGRMLDEARRHLALRLKRPDFAGTGVATWSTPNLMRALADHETGG